MADVKITIDIDADTAAIDRVRQKLRRLCMEADDCTDTMDKHATSLRDLGKAQDDAGKNTEKNGKKMGTLGKIAKFLNGGLKKLAMLGFKYVAIEAAAALAVIGSAGILFKAGALLAKGYQMALSGVAYALAAVIAGAAAFAAAQRQFQSVQFAPAFSEGAINTESSFAAASGAMKMFVDDTQLAVIGTKGLSSAFKTLNDQQAVTGKTTAVFRELSNYTAGMGGDMEKGSQAMAKFLAQFQKDKSMTGAVTDAGKQLGPEFEKILKEARKKGLTSYDKFAKAAMDGELGETFSKYAGQLDAVNSTVIGKFKQAFAGIKSSFVEMGEPLLGPITKEIPRIANIIQALLLRIRGNVQEVGSGSLLTGIVNVFDKVANIVGNLVAGDLGKAGKLVSGMRTAVEWTGKAFEKVQDYLRPLVAASEVLWATLKPILGGFAGNFGSTIQTLSDSLVANKDSFVEFGNAIGKFLNATGQMGTMIKEVIIDLLPTASDTIRIFSEIITSAKPVFKAVLSFLKPILQVVNFVLKALLNVAEAIDVVLNPIISVLTLGLGDVKNVVKSLTAAVLLLGAAMVYSYSKGGIVKKAKDWIDGDSVGGQATKKGLKKGGKLLGRGLKSGGKALMRGGSAALKLAGGGSAAAGALAIGGGTVAGLGAAKLFERDDSIKSRSLSGLTGAAGGAALGAAATAWLGPGAAVGAVVGGIIGGVVGFIKAGKMKKEARKAASAVINDYMTNMDKAIKNGDIDALKKSKTDARKAAQAMFDKGGLSAGEMKKRLKDLEKLNKQVDTYIGNAGNFKQFGGMDADKMNEMLSEQKYAADAAKNEVLNVFEIMRKGGIDVGAAWDKTMGGINQRMLELRVAMFDINTNSLVEQQKAVDAAQRKLLEGDTSEESVTAFLKSAYEYALGQTGGDAVRATALMEETLGKAYGPKGSLNKVAKVVQDQADKIKIFDPNVLVNQMIQSGQLETQGKAIEAISGGQVTANQAELQIQTMIAGAGSKGAAKAAEIQSVMTAYMQGQVSREELLAALFDASGKKMEEVHSKVKSFENFALQNQDRTDANGRMGFGASSTSVVPAMSSQSVEVGGVTVQVSGFITDEKTAKWLAKMIADQTGKDIGRRMGSPTTATGFSVPTGGGSGGGFSAPTGGSGGGGGFSVPTGAFQPGGFSSPNPYGGAGGFSAPTTTGR
jgi:hypothetical protein